LVLISKINYNPNEKCSSRSPKMQKNNAIFLYRSGVMQTSRFAHRPRSPKIKITPPPLLKICVIYFYFKPFEQPVKLNFFQQIKIVKTSKKGWFSV